MDISTAHYLERFPMLPLLTSEQMREHDRHAIKEIGIPGIVLMENAARSVIEVIEERYGDVEDLLVAVICGPGNNGGDGFAVARQIHLRGGEVDLHVLCDESEIKGDALTNFRLLAPLGIAPAFWGKEPQGRFLDGYDLLIDAIFGTGTVRAPSGPYAEALAAMNESGVPILAIDVPSGVDASTGRVPGVAVTADVTVTLQHTKCGLLLPPGRDHAGDIVTVPISIPDVDEVLDQAAFVLPEDFDVLTLLPNRPRHAHKGVFGNLLVIAGSRGMSGAARLVGMAALRSGVGLVKVATPESIRGEVAAYHPELMTIGLPETATGAIAHHAYETLRSHCDWADVVAIGPGLGRDVETAQFLRTLLQECSRPLVIDADGLNLMADSGALQLIPPATILTPHPGEFDRLAGSKALDFYARGMAAREFAIEHSCVVLLKGAPTICFDPEGPAVINPTGNPGLATGGSGDVLTGIVASLLAQGVEPRASAWMGAFLHGRAADKAVLDIGEASLVAGDVIEYLPEAFESVADLNDDDEFEDDSSCECGRGR